LASPRSSEWLHRKAPQLVAAAISIALVVVVIVEILEDTLIEGAPMSTGPLLWLWNGIILITRNVTAAVSSWGYTGVFVLMLLESSSLPIPSEMILPFTGYVVSLGQLNLWWSIAVATAAGISGSLVDYYIGWKGWNFLTQHRILGKSLFSKSQFDVAAGWFSRHGSIVVFLSRLVPGFRTLVSFPAGAIKMPLTKFAVYTTAGCLLWNSLLIYFGYFLGSQWAKVAGISHYLIIIAVVAFVSIFIGYFLWRRRKGGYLKNSFITSNN
jgi:membrane protein DedA with SNARE-associated domain